MLKAIRSTLLMLSFVVALTFTATSVSAQEKAQPNKTKVPVTVEKNIDYVLLQIERLQALQDCRNLMGKYSYYHAASRNIDYVELWAPSGRMTALRCPGAFMTAGKGSGDVI